MPMNEIVRRLSQVLNDLKAVNSRLDDVNRNWVDPPDPDKPAVRSSLNDVKTQVANAGRLADAMLLKLG